MSGPAAPRSWKLLFPELESHIPTTVEQAADPGLFLALNLRLTPVQLWDLLLLGRCHALKLSLGSLSPNYPSGLFESHYTLSIKGKDLRDKASGS